MSDIQPVKNGALYIRVSTHLQEELSPDAQKRLLMEYAEAHNIIVLKEHIYIDSGISGRSARQRPQFNNMIAEAKSKEHPFDVILVWKYSRFARNQEESIVYKSMLKRENVDVISVSEPISDDPFGSLIERIIEWMDEYYSIRLSGEVSRGMAENAMRGNYQARPPLGYRIPGYRQTPVIVPEEAELIQLIFDLYTEKKMGIFEIVRYLNEHGYQTGHKKPFQRRSVTYILKNPTYIGKTIWNQHDQDHKLRDKSEWIIADGKHEPIISKEQFDKAQKRIESTYKPAYRKPTSVCHHWLSSLLKCSSCGRTLVVKRTASKNKDRMYINFQCYGYQKGICNTNQSISAIKLEPVIMHSLEDAMTSGKIHFDVLNPTTLDSSQKQQLLTRLNEIEKKEVRIKRAYRDGIDTLEEYKENKSIIQTEKEMLLKKIEHIEEPALSPEEAKPIMMDRIKNVYEVITNPDIGMEEKNKAARSIIEKIVFDRATGSVNIFFYLANCP